MDWPYSEAQNTMVITTMHVIKSNRDIVYVSHDDDGMWQFLSDDDVSVEEAMVVSLREIFMIDESIGTLFDLPYGYYAERADKTIQWKIGRL